MATTPAAAQAEAQEAIDVLKETPESHPLYPARALRAIALTAQALAAQNAARAEADQPKRTPRSTKPSSSTTSSSKDLA